ncbi:UDP-N-acetylglucosamine 4,6-dehydratase (inverting) [Salinibacter ruber]|uniref:UDP-N-acetylglucosamine 4,6-dehydratase (inverting) n=1 Tax=Salinibacter ruber TaxID=146919 RepID=UPI002167D8CD|nr:UDP-N-acetylglucosamine 4,6-dehydratase (inverting) [Salinibacter ruber]MCS3643314.1 UDP-N-acetylglucosamine 4,6-dehydratase [Salinibacter ruber]
MIDFDGKDILITGGTGSFGKKCTQILLDRYDLNRLIILSRDELKQARMKQRFSPQEHPCLRYFIGDVREKDRLYRAFSDVDIVIHAAALKRVPAAEYNPIEPIKTNVMGGSNVIEAAIDRNVDRVIALSTDKGANPINLYGATKLCADKLFVAGNNYSGDDGTRFSVVRYGNVVGSRGSVIPFFLEKRETGTLPITDPRMTRFWITLEQAVDFVLTNFERMEGGEVFVPKIPSMKITDLAEAIAPECDHEVVGIRPGEKLHEVMVPRNVARSALEFEDYFAILPSFQQWDQEGYHEENGGSWCDDQFKYSSDTNDQWLSAEEIRGMIGPEKVAIEEHRERANEMASK